MREITNVNKILTKNVNVTDRLGELDVRRWDLKEISYYSVDSIALIYNDVQWRDHVSVVTNPWSS
jgi:hypothetical protein